MENLMTKSLAGIVNSNHRAAGIFEKYHLDFCCKGKRSLAEACEEAALKADDIISELGQLSVSNSCTVPVNFERFSLQQLADYIVNTHHSFTKKEMPLICDYLAKVEARHGDQHPEVKKVRQLFIELTEEMFHHMQNEEVVLFPRIKELEKCINSQRGVLINHLYLRNPIDVMEDDHENAGRIMNEIRILTNGFTAPQNACTTFRLAYAALQAFQLDLHQHVHLENNILFPRALKLRGEGDTLPLSAN